MTKRKGDNDELENNETKKTKLDEEEEEDVREDENDGSNEEETNNNNGEEDEKEDDDFEYTTTPETSNVNKTPAYFISLLPEEDGETYNEDDETVEYTITFKKLQVDGKDASILDWFNLFNSNMKKEGSTEADKENWIMNDLGIPNLIAVHGFWGLYSEDNEETLPAQIDVKSFVEYPFEEICACERYVKMSDNSLLFGSTSEFDVEYAFFTADAITQNQLGKYLKTVVKLEDNGSVVCPQSKARFSAYL